VLVERIVDEHVGCEGEGLLRSGQRKGSALRARFFGRDESPPFHRGHAGREFRCHKAIFGERVWRLQSSGLSTEADKGRKVPEPAALIGT